MNRVSPLEYPLNAPSYLPAFDDGPWVQQELQQASETWRSEKWAPQSNVLILDHSRGESKIDYYDDAGLTMLLEGPDPQVRFLLLAPTNQEKIQHEIKDHKAAKVYYNNGLLDDPDYQTPLPNDSLTHAVKEVGRSAHIEDPAEEKTHAPRVSQALTQPDAKVEEIPSQLNISRKSLLEVLTKYDIAPLACSHIRGQEQVFGSRACRDESGKVVSSEFWYAIRARSYFPIIKGGKDGDLKMTIVTRYDVRSGSTFILLKYRSFNDLTERLKRELTQKLIGFVRDPTTASLTIDPFALPLWHFNVTIQYFRRATRLPRDAIRQQEVKVHGSSDELAEMNLQMLHLALGSLDQDKIQMAFLINTIRQLRVQHDLFYRLVGDEPNRDRPVWVYHRVREELDRYECQLEYFKSSVEDVAGKGQRLLNLSFNLQSRKMAEQTYQQTEQTYQQTENARSENFAMKTIAIMTMMFLPASFVTGLLGTNLFFISDSSPSSTDNAQKVVAPQLWIFFAVAVPLTVITFLAWLFWSKSQKRRLKQRDVGHNSVV